MLIYHLMNILLCEKVVYLVVSSNVGIIGVYR